MRIGFDNRDEQLKLDQDLKETFRHALGVALEQEGVQEDAEISVSFVGAEEIRALNRDYRGNDSETDVLSFPVYEAQEVGALKDAGRLDVLGDIVINMNRVRAQAREYGHSETREMLYLAVHSLLHLLGYDHEEEEDRRRMRSHEEAIMNRIGEPEPEAEGFGAEELLPGASPGESRSNPASFHSGYVALIGRPNVGKSTLVNHLLGEKLSIVSNKPQTTRHRLQYIYTDQRMQAIFLDTPGVQIPKNELGEAMLRISRNALEGVDVCLFVTDVSSRIGPLDRRIIERLSQIRGIPMVMLLNKTDAVPPEWIEAEQRRYEELGIFEQILPISAKKQKNLDALLDIIYEALPEGPMYYSEEMITDRSERFIITELIREKCLMLMQDEIPHGIHVGIDQMTLRPDGSLYDIYATIYCEKPSHKGMIIGKGGSKLRQIGQQARRDIEALVDLHVNLKLWVKVDANWRKKKAQVKRLGFED